MTDDKRLAELLRRKALLRQGKKIKVDKTTWLGEDIKDKGSDEKNLAYNMFKKGNEKDNPLVSPTTLGTSNISRGVTPNQDMSQYLTEEEKQGKFFRNDENFLKNRRRYNQSIMDRIAIATSEFVPGVVGAIGQGFGVVGGGVYDLANKALSSVGVVDPAEKVYMFDNAFIDLFKGVDEHGSDALIALKQSIFGGADEIFASADYENERSFWKKVTNQEFIFKDLVQGLEFAASMYFTGGAGSVGAAGNLGRLGKASNLLRSGLSPFSTLAKTGAKALNMSATNINRAGYYGGLIHNTIAEAGMEAAEVYKNIKEQYKDNPKLKNPQTGNPYTPEEIEEIASERGYNTFIGNASMLILTNAVELRSMYKFIDPNYFKQGSKTYNKAKEALKKQVLNNTPPSAGKELLKGIGVGIFSEGLIEENIQSAISKVEENLTNYNGLSNWTITPWASQALSNARSFGKGVLGYNLNKDEMEGALSIAAGSMIGGGLSTLASLREHGENLKEYEDLKEVYKDFQSKWDLVEKQFGQEYSSLFNYKEKEIEYLDEDGNAQYKTVRNYLDENGKMSVDENLNKKLFFQTMQNKARVDLIQSALETGDSYLTDYNRNFVLGTLVHSLSTNKFLENKKDLIDNVRGAISNSFTDGRSEEFQLTPEDSQGLQDLAEEYVEIWDKIDNSTRYKVKSIDDAKFLDQFKKLKFYSQIKKKSLEDMRDRASEENKTDLVANLDNLISKEDEFYNQYVNKIKSFKKIYDEKIGSVSKLNEKREKIKSDLTGELTQEERSKKIKDLKELNYIIKEGQEVFGNGIEDINTSISKRGVMSLSKKDQYYFNLGNTGQAITEVQDRNVLVKQSLSKLNNTQNNSKDYESQVQEVNTQLKDLFKSYNANKKYLDKNIVESFEESKSLYNERKGFLETNLKSLNDSLNKIDSELQSLTSQLENSVSTEILEDIENIIELSLETFGEVSYLFDEQTLESIENLFQLSSNKEQLEGIIDVINTLDSNVLSQVEEESEVNLKEVQSQAIDLFKKLDTDTSLIEENISVLNESKSQIQSEVFKSKKELDTFNSIVTEEYIQAEDNVYKAIDKNNLRSEESLDLRLQKEFAEIPILRIQSELDFISSKPNGEEEYSGDIRLLQKLKEDLEVRLSIYNENGIRKHYLKRKDYSKLNENLKQALKDVKYLDKISKANSKKNKQIEAKIFEENIKNKLSSIGLSMSEGNIVISNTKLLDIIKKGLTGNINNTSEEILSELLYDVKDIKLLNVGLEIIKELLIDNSEIVDSIKKTWEQELNNDLDLYIDTLKEISSENDIYIGYIDPILYRNNPSLFESHITSLLSVFNSSAEYSGINEDKHPNYIYKEVKDENKLLEYLESVKDTVVKEFGESYYDKLTIFIGLHKNYKSKKIALDFWNSNYRYSQQHFKEAQYLLEKSNEEGIQYAPTLEQRSAYQKILNYFNINIDVKNSSNPKRTNSNNISYLSGPAGSGKTNAVLNWTSKILDLNKEEIYSFSHNLKSTETITKSINGTQGSLKNFLETDLSTYKLIVIDEIGFFSEKDVKAIETVLTNENLKRNSEDQLKMIVLGDPGQIRKEAVSPLERFSSNLTEAKVIDPLRITHRSGIPSIKDFQNQFRRRSSSVSNLIAVSNKDLYSQYDSYTPVLGVQGSTNEKDLVSHLLLNLKSGRSKALITSNSSKKEMYLRNPDIAKMVQEQELEVLTYAESQGQTFSEVYIDIQKTDKSIKDEEFSKLNSELEYNTAIYTATSRSKDYIFIVHPSIKENIKDEELLVDSGQNNEDIQENFSEFSQLLVEESSLLEKYIPDYTSLDIKEDVSSEINQNKDNSEELTMDSVDESNEEIETENSIGQDTLLLSYKEQEEKHILDYPQSRTNRGTQVNVKGPLPRSEKNSASPVIYVKVEDKGKEYVGIFAQDQLNGEFIENSWTKIGVLSEKESDRLLGNKFLNQIPTYTAKYNSDTNQFSSGLNGVKYENGKAKLVATNFSPLYNTTHKELAFNRDLTFIYNVDQANYSQGWLEDTVNKFKSQFFKGEPKNFEYEIKIYSKTELDKDPSLYSQQRHGHTLKPGIPYLVFKNPQDFDANNPVTDIALRLTPRPLNLKDFSEERDSGLGEYGNIIDFVSTLENLNLELKGLKFGDPIVSTLFQKIARAKDSNNQSGFINYSTNTVEFTRHQYSYEDFLQDKNKGYSELQFEISQDNFNTIQKYSKEVIPAIYGMQDKPVTFTEEEWIKINENTNKEQEYIELGYEVVKEDNLFKVVKNPLQKNEKPTPNYKVEYLTTPKLVANRGSISKTLNKIVKSNPLMEIAVIDKHNKTIRSKPLLASESYEAYANHLIEIVDRYLEDYPENKSAQEIKENLNQYTLSRLEKLVSTLIKNDEEYKNINLEDLKEKYTTQAIDLDLLSKYFSPSAFDSQGNSNYGDGQYLSVNLNMNYVNKLGKDLNEFNISKLEKLMGSKLEKVEGDKTIVQTSQEIKREPINIKNSSTQEVVDRILKGTSTLTEEILDNPSINLDEVKNQIPTKDQLDEGIEDVEYTSELNQDIDLQNKENEAYLKGLEESFSDYIEYQSLSNVEDKINFLNNYLNNINNSPELSNYKDNSQSSVDVNQKIFDNVTVSIVDNIINVTIEDQGELETYAFENTLTEELEEILEDLDLLDSVENYINSVLNRRTYNSSIYNMNEGKSISTDQAIKLASKYIKVKDKTHWFKSLLSSLLDPLSKEELNLKFFSKAAMKSLERPGESLKGLYENGTIYILKDSKNKVKKNILRHEIFHKIFNEFLTPLDQDKIFMSVKRTYPETKDYSKIELEEFLANKFGEFKYQPLNFQGRIKNFFSNILNGFKSVQDNKSDYLDLFERIEKGYYRKKSSPFKHKLNRKTYLEIKKNFTSISVFKDVSEYVHKRFIDLDENPNIALSKEELFNEVQKSLVRDYNSLANSIQNLKEKLENLDFENNIEEYVKTKDKEIEELYQYHVLSKAIEVKNFQTVIKYLYPKTSFTKTSVKFLNKNTIDIDVLEEETYTYSELVQGSNLKDVIEEAEHTNNEDSISFNVKLFLSNILNQSTGEVLHSGFSFINTVRLMESLSFEPIQNTTFLDRLGEAVALSQGYNNINELINSPNKSAQKSIYLKIKKVYENAINPKVSYKTKDIDGSSISIKENLTDRIRFLNEDNLLVIVTDKKDPEYNKIIDLINNNRSSILIEQYKNNNKWKSKYLIYNRKDSQLLKEQHSVSIKKGEPTYSKVYTEVLINSAANYVYNNTNVSEEFRSKSELLNHFRTAFNKYKAESILQDMYLLMSSMREKNLYIANFDPVSNSMEYIPENAVSVRIAVKDTIKNSLLNYFETNSKSKLNILQNKGIISDLKLPASSENYNNVKNIQALNSLFNILGIDNILEEVDTNSLIKVANDLGYFFSTHISKLGTKKNISKEENLDSEETEELEDSEYTIEDIIEKEGSVITSISRIISENNEFSRMASVKDVNGNTVYLHHDSSQGDDLIVNLSKLKEGVFKGGSGIKQTLKVPEYLSTPFFQNNIFTKGINKLYGIIDHDGIKNTLSNNTIGYTRESELDWISRNLNHAFIGIINNSSKRNPQYAQYFYTISNRPRIKGAKVKVLDHIEIKKSIEQFFYQLDARPNLKGVFKNYDKYKTTNFTIIDKALKNIDSDLTLEQYVQEGIVNEKGELTDKVKTLVDKAYDQLTLQSKEYAKKLIETDFKFPIETISAINKISNKIDKSIFENEIQISSLLNTQDNKYTLDNIHYLVDLLYKNHYVNSYYLNQLVAGDNAFFKDSLDMIKRMSGIFAPGKKPLVHPTIGAREKFNVVVVKDAVENSQSIKDFLNRLFIKENQNYNSLSKAEKEKIDSEVEAVFKKFGEDYEPTDAQGFITPERAEELRKALGPSFKAGSIFKGAHYENTIQTVNGEKVTIPVMIKYSSVELSDNLIYEYRKIDGVNTRVVRYPELLALRNKMRLSKDKNGNIRPIDELIFGSANKLGQPIVKLSSAESMNRFSEFPIESVLELSNENYRVQSNPDHTVEYQGSRVSNPTQLTYFLSVMSELTSNSSEIKNTIYNELSDLFLRGKNLFLNSISNEKGDLDTNKFTNFIKGLMTGEGNERIYELLSEGISYNAPQIVNKVFSQVTSKLTRQSVGVKFPGDKLTLQSTYGIKLNSNKENNKYLGQFDSETLNQGEELKYYINEQGGLEAEVILPKGLFPTNIEKKMLEGGSILTSTPDALGFRIPSTQLHSSVALRVKNFYDSRGTGMIIAPKELVPLHGSDFDVDSLFVIHRSYLTSSDLKSLGLDRKDERYKKLKDSPIGYYMNSKGVYEMNQQSIQEFKDMLLELNTEGNTKKIHQLEDQLSMNIIVENFLKTITDPGNLKTMLSPISMEEFNGKDKSTNSGFREDSIFHMISNLQYQQIEAQYQAGILSEEEYNSKIKDGYKIQSVPDLSTLEGNYEVFKSNMDGRSLTGVFANVTKVLAYLTNSGINSSKDTSNPELQIKEVKQYELNKEISNLKLKLEDLNKQEFSELIEIQKNTLEETIKNLEEKLDVSKTKDSNTYPILTNITQDDFYFEFNGNKYYKLSEKFLNTDTFIWDTLDSLINSAIDNVKEQILPVINANSLTANAIGALVSLGIPIKTIVLLLKQSSVNQLDVTGNKTIETAKMYNSIRDVLADLLIQEDKISDKEEIDQYISNNRILLTDTILEANYINGEILSNLLNNNNEKALSKIIGNKEKALLIHLEVLDQLKKAIRIGEDIADLSSALNIVRSFPSNMSDLHKINESWNNIFPFNERGVREFNSNYSYYIPNFLDINPHIKSSLEILDTLNKVVETGFLKHNPKITEIATSIYSSNNLKVKKNKYDSIEYIKDELMSFLFSSIDLMKEVGDYSTNTPRYGKPRSGHIAWSNNFAEKVEKLKAENSKLKNRNKFLDIISIKKSKKGEASIYFSLGNNTNYADILSLQQEFSNLEDNIQDEFIKYAVINFGIQFGSTNYSQIIPPTLLKPYIDQMVTRVNRVIDEEYEGNLLDLFEVQLILNNGYSIRKIRPSTEDIIKTSTVTDKDIKRYSGYDNVENKYYNLKIKKEVENSSKRFIRMKDTLYKNIGEWDNHYHYIKVGKVNDRKSFYLSKKVFNEGYSLDVSFSSYAIPMISENVGKEEVTGYIMDTYPNNIGTILAVRTMQDKDRSSVEFYKISEILSDYKNRTELSEGVQASEVKAIKLTKEELIKEKLLPQNDISFTKIKKSIKPNSFKSSNVQIYSNVKVGDITNISDVISDIKENGSYSGKTLINLLNAFNNNLLEGVKVNWGKSEEGELGYYDTSNPLNITVNLFDSNGNKYDNGTIEKTLFHELSHLLTYKTLSLEESKLTSKQLNAKRNLINVYESFKNQLNKEGKDIKSIYGLTNIYEFISEAFTNDKFQELLDSYKINQVKKQSFLGRFIEIIKGLFNIKNNNSVLSIVLNESLLIMNNPKGITSSEILYSKELESTYKNDSILNSILNTSKLWEVPVDEKTLEQGEYYENKETGKQLNRVSNFMDKFLDINKTDKQLDFATRTANSIFKNVEEGSTKPIDGIRYTKEEYIEHLREVQNKGKIKGKITHTLAEIVTHNQYSKKTLEELENELLQWYQNSEVRNPENTYGWIRETLPKVLTKLGINYFDTELIKEEDRDLLLSEQTVASELLGFVGTVDLLVRHSRGDYSLIDYKSTKSFDKEIENRIFKYGNQLSYLYNNPKNKAQLQMTLYALALKVENPDIKFRDITALWMPNKYEANAYDPHSRTDIHSFLKMIEDYYKNEMPEKYKQIKKASPNAFNYRHYNSSESTLETKMVKQNKTALQVFNAEQQKLKVLIQSNLDKRFLSAEDRQEIENLTKTLVNFANDNGYPIKNWLEDISEGSRWLGSYSDVNHPVIEAFRSVLDEAKDRANKDYIKDYIKYESLLKEVLKEQVGSNMFKKLTSKYTLVGDWINLSNVQYKDLYSFAYKEFKIDGSSILRLKTEKDSEWEGLSKAQKNYLTFVNDKFGQFFDSENGFLHETAANLEVNGSFKTLTNLELFNKNKADIDKFEYYRGFLPIVPPEERDIIEKYGALSKNYLKYLKNKYLTYFYEYQYEQWGESEEGIPIRYLGTRHQRMYQNHTMNLSITFDRYMRSMYQKKHGDYAHALSRGLQVIIENNRDKKDKLLIEDFLDNHIDLHLLNRTAIPKDLTKLPFIKKGRDGRIEKVRLDKLYKSIKSFTSGAYMQLNPIGGGKNFLLASIMTKKEGLVNSILKNLPSVAGIDQGELDFTSADLTLAMKDVIKYMGDTMAGKHRDNKIFLLMEELRFSTTAFEFATEDRYLETAKKAVLGSENFYLFYSLPEEYIAATIMVAQLRRMKLQSNSKVSVWDSYQVTKNEDGNSELTWKGDPRGYKKVNGEYIPLTKLDHHETAHLRQIYKRIHGGYRRDERTALDFYIVGQMINQFKKYLPGLLKSTFESKSESNTLGSYREVIGNDGKVEYIEKDGKKIPILEWKKRVIEGRWRTLAMYIKHMLEIMPLIGSNGLMGMVGWDSGNVEYKWSNLSTTQKKNIIEAVVTLTGFFLAYALFLNAYSDDPENSYRRKFWSYIIDSSTQNYNVRDMIKNIANFSDSAASTRTYKTVESITKLGWYGYINPFLDPTYEEGDEFTEDGSRKGMIDLIRGIPLLGGTYEIKKWLKNLEDEGDQRFRAKY